MEDVRSADFGEGDVLYLPEEGHHPYVQYANIEPEAVEVFKLRGAHDRGRKERRRRGIMAGSILGLLAMASIPLLVYMLKKPQVGESTGDTMVRYMKRGINKLGDLKTKVLDDLNELAALLDYEEAPDEEAGAVKTEGESPEHVTGPQQEAVPSVAIQPEGVGPQAVQPGAAQQEAVNPEVINPDAVKPDAVPPDAVAVKPETVTPEETQMPLATPDDSPEEVMAKLREFVDWVNQTTDKVKQLGYRDAADKLVYRGYFQIRGVQVKLLAYFWASRSAEELVKPILMRLVKDGFERVEPHTFVIDTTHVGTPWTGDLVVSFTGTPSKGTQAAQPDSAEPDATE
ncbi:hypothetical protein Efla_001428 [Eimeria flavescens]